MKSIFKQKRSCCLLISIFLVLSTILASSFIVNANDPNDYYMVRFNNIPSIEKREILSSYLEFHRYLGDEIFICEIPKNNIQYIETEESVKFIEIIKPNYKISPSLTDKKEVTELIICTYTLGDVEPVAGKIKEMGGRIKETQKIGIPRIYATVYPKIISAIAEIKDVYYIQEDIDETEFLDLITTTTYMGMDAAQIGGFTGTGIMGEVQDGGCQMSHPDFDVDYYDGPVSTDAHGTCTYGIVFSEGTNDIRAQGTLYDAISVFADYNVQTQYNSVLRLWRGTFSSGNAGQNGLFQSNSWGHMGSNGGVYNSYTNEADEASYDYQNLLALWAAGNSNYGVFKGSLSYQAACKNGLTVGAVWHKNTASMSDDDWHSGGIGNTPSQGPLCSSRSNSKILATSNHITSSTDYLYRISSLNRIFNENIFNII